MAKDVGEYIDLLKRETAYSKEALNSDTERAGYSLLAQHGGEGLLSGNVVRLGEVSP